MIVGLASDYHPQVLIVKQCLIHQTLCVLVDLPLASRVYSERCPLAGRVFLGAT